MRVAVVGAGALGLYYGSMLQKAGHDVKFLLRRDYNTIIQEGLTVFSINGDFKLFPVAGYLQAEEIGPVDLVLVGLKTCSNSHYRELIAPLVAAHTIILTLQNGLGNEDALANIFGSDRVMGGVAFLCCNRGRPGVIHHLAAGRIALGEPFLPGMARINQIAAVFNGAGVPCRGVDDLRKAKWEKLIWNIPFNGTCALLQKPVDQLLLRPQTRQFLRSIMLEMIAAANAQGLSSVIPDTYADEMIAFTEKMESYKPSMQIDREEVRPLELEAFLPNLWQLPVKKA